MHLALRASFLDLFPNKTTGSPPCWALPVLIWAKLTAQSTLCGRVTNRAVRTRQTNAVVARHMPVLKLRRRYPPAHGQGVSAGRAVCGRAFGGVAEHLDITNTPRKGSGTSWGSEPSASSATFLGGPRLCPTCARLRDDRSVLVFLA